jgi:hypothetical protein
MEPHFSYKSCPSARCASAAEELFVQKWRGIYELERERERERQTDRQRRAQKKI